VTRSNFHNRDPQIFEVCGLLFVFRCANSAVGLQVFAVFNLRYTERASGFNKKYPTFGGGVAVMTSKTSFLSDYHFTAFFMTFFYSYVKCACSFVDTLGLVGIWASALTSVNSDLRSDLSHFVTNQHVCGSVLSGKKLCCLFFY